MLVTQSYAQPSGATLEGNSFQLKVATEQSRPPVRLYATVKDGLAYARLMKTLYAVVCGDLRTPKKDRTAYFEWVQQRYLDELSEQQAATLAKIPAWAKQRDELRAQVKELNKTISGLGEVAYSGEYWHAYHKYYNYLMLHDFSILRLLDPVVSVHPDCVIFEAFSVDESSYGRVTVPMQGLALHGPVDYGTTNIDFSPALAREIARIRSYRPTDLHIGPNQVVVATNAGAAIEKKIDLPASWVRGFLQVQSAATLPGLEVRLSAATMAEILAELKRRREDKGPRSLKFILKPGEKPVLEIEPWGIVINEPKFVWQGSQPQEIRIWGRRRLLVLDEVLAHAQEVQVRLLGSGMPSYWTVFCEELRFDMGLSGWTQNDWSKAAQFDLLAATSTASAASLVTVEKILKDKLHLTPQQTADEAGISRQAATAALQQLCWEGRAMYDQLTGSYRWRQLFPFMPEPQAQSEDERNSSARRLIERKAVALHGPVSTPEGNMRFEAEVSGEKTFNVLLDLNLDGRVVYAQCTCGTYRRDKLRKGPCAHILATTILATPVEVAYVH